MMDFNTAAAQAHAITDHIAPIVVDCKKWPDFEANKTYNKVVVNGDHKPENFGEMIYEMIDNLVSKGIVSSAVAEAYKQTCWHKGDPDDELNDMFEYPASKDVAAVVTAA